MFKTIAAWCALMCSSLGPAVVAQEIEPPAITDARTLLNNLGVDDAALNSFDDEQPLEGAQFETIARMIAAMRKATRKELDAFVKPLPNEAPTFPDGRELRGGLFSFEGRVIRVSAAPSLPAELADGLRLPKLFRCEIAWGPAGSIAEALAPAIPRAWPLDQVLDEPVRVQGYFARLVADPAVPDQRRPVFAALRVAWHPPNRLSELGMDFGLFDLTGARTQLHAKEAECFYSLLGAVGRSKPGELTAAAAGQTHALLPLLTDPRRHAGELVAFTGTASRALLIRADEELQRRFGIEYYFQVEMDAELEQPVLYNNHPYRRFPVVALVRELPAKMPVGEDIHANVRVAGFFYSTWDYRSGAAKDPAKRDQFAPLIVARDLVWIESTNDRDNTAGLIAAGLFALTIVGGWFLYWRSNRSDRQFRDKLYRREGNEANLG